MSDNLRPLDWTEYIGQERLKAMLDVKIKAALRARRPLEPILLTGPPGAGKTSLATLIAQRMGVPFTELIMPVSEAAMHSTIKQFEGVLLLDELHAAGKLQEKLQPLLEFGYMTENSGRRIKAGNLTIIGATTREQLIIEPLWDRFFVPTIDPYTDEEMRDIVLGMADKARMFNMKPEVAMAFGRAACGTPRRARQFVLAYAELWAVNEFSPNAEAVFTYLRVEADGLTVNHLRYLQTLGALGGTKGLKIIASLLRLNESVVIGLERLLLERGMIEMAERGRSMTRAGFARLREEEAAA